MLPKALQVSILREEGGYVNHPDDPGGETIYGISKHQYPHLDIKKVTKEQAFSIYEEEYWSGPKIDKLHLPLAYLVFDFGVNAGTRRAIKLLQEVLGLPQDGLLGPATRSAALADPTVARRFTDARVAYYKRLNKPMFEKGWIIRSERIYKEFV